MPLDRNLRTARSFHTLVSTHTYARSLKFDDNFGGHEVHVHQLIMNEDGWFSAAPYEYSGETISPHGHTMEAVTGEYRLIWHNPNQKFVNEQSADVEKPISIRLNPDGTVTGDIQAAWEMRDGTPYMSFTWGGVTYKGAFIVQQDEADLPVPRMCFTATGINICIWGSKTAAYDPAADSLPQEIQGDVNDDGAFDIVDIVSMQKYLLGAGTMQSPDRGDFCEDGVLDIYDLGLMKNRLLHILTV